MHPDQSITFLKALGYGVVRMPRADLKPSQTLLRTGKKDLSRLGELGTIMQAGARPLPPLSTDNVAPTGVSGLESNSMKVEIGLTILGNILQALGGGNLGLSTAFQRAKSVTFKYENVLEDHIALDQLDQFLSTASIKGGQTTVTDALINDNVFVITSAIKSKSITVAAKADNGVSVSVDVPTIQGVASGNLKVDVSGATQGQVTYSGDTPVVFGFQAAQLFFDNNGQFTLIQPLDAGAAALKAVTGHIRPTLLTLDEGAFFRLDETAAAVRTAAR
jgi:hypothetical protein